jgi:soluble lytic murein transglycosylase-like protein
MQNKHRMQIALHAVTNQTGVIVSRTFLFAAWLAASVVHPCAAQAGTTCTGRIFDEAAAPYGLDPTLLKAITWVESHGNPDAVGPRLKDGHRAWGAAQINDIHLAELAPYGVTRRDLLDPCVNLRLSAWVLANCMQQTGPTWAAVGCYNTGPGSRNYAAQLKYVRLVKAAYDGYRGQAVQARAANVAAQ